MPANDSPKMIADKIFETTESLKIEATKVVLPVIVLGGDKLNEKTEKVNNLLEKACNQNQIDLIKHSNINTERHLNSSRVHLKDSEKRKKIYTEY